MPNIITYIIKAVIFLLVQTEAVLLLDFSGAAALKAEDRLRSPTSPSLHLTSFLFQPHIPKPIPLQSKNNSKTC